MLKQLFLCFCLLMAGIGVVKAGDTYVKVTSPSDLVVGGTYIMAATNDGVTRVATSFNDVSGVLNTETSGFTVDGSTITITTASPLEFILGGNSEGYTLNFNSTQYLGYRNLKFNVSYLESVTLGGISDKERWRYISSQFVSYVNGEYQLGIGGDAIKAVNVTVTSKTAYLYRKGFTTVTLSSACTDGARYYGTYSIGSSFIVPSDLTVSEIQVSDGKLVVSSYETGDVVPANTGVMISAATAGAHQLTLSSAAGTSLYGAGNMLHASGEGITAEAMAAAHPGCKFYRLTMHLGTTLGYYWGAADGAAFALSANKAYLAVPAAASRLTGFDMADEEEPTGISAVLNDKERMKNDRGQALNDKVFDLNGRTVIGNVRGVVIKNGKKLLNK
jgi:hypothetical protein